MKNIFNFILTILTILLLVLMIYTRLNLNAKWVDLSSYQHVIDICINYGPMVLLCLFAFGSLLVKFLAHKIIFIVVVVLLAVFTISYFAPELITSIIGQIGV